MAGRGREVARGDFFQGRAFGGGHFRLPARTQGSGDGVLDFATPLVLRDAFAQRFFVAGQSSFRDLFFRLCVDLMMPFGKPGDYLRRHALDFKITRVVFNLITERP